MSKFHLLCAASIVSLLSFSVYADETGSVESKRQEMLKSASPDVQKELEQFKAKRKAQYERLSPEAKESLKAQREEHLKKTKDKRETAREKLQNAKKDEVKEQEKSDAKPN